MKKGVNMHNDIENLKEQIEIQKNKAKKLRANNKALKEKVLSLEKDKWFLETKIKTLEDKIKDLEQLAYRGGGRPPRFTREQKIQIVNKYRKGGTIREVAKEFNCSVGLVHKLINEYRLK